MKLAVAGTGYVGLVTGVCFAEKGYDVICVDIDTKKIEMLNNGISPIYEEGLNEMLNNNKGKILFTSDYKTAYSDADIIFIAVGTPEKFDGSANLNYVYKVVEQVAESAVKDCIIVIKSTVPVGTNDEIEKLIKSKCKNSINISVASNPEFLSQGTAIKDTMNASRIVIGVSDSEIGKTLKELYSCFDVPVILTDRCSAEMVKYAANNFLALKLSYINEIANLCEIVGANILDVVLGIGYDPRIGNKFLNAGIGYGGSCFPKDTKALHWLANINDYELKTIKAAIEINEKQKLKLIEKSRKYYTNFEGLTIAVLGLTFKPNTDDVRESPSLRNIPVFLEDGATVKAWDPVGIENFKKIYPHEINYCSCIEDTLKDADICFIFTEWDEIKRLTPDVFMRCMKKPIVLDGRNCFDINIMKNNSIIYQSIGR